jgi:stage IV sporulation protein FB
MEERHRSGPVKLSGLSIVFTIPCQPVTKRINLLILPLAAAAAVFGYMDDYLLVYCCMIAHESAHIIAAIANGNAIGSVTLFPTGLSAEIRDNWSISNGRLVVLAAGPLFNLLLAFIFSLYKANGTNDTVQFFVLMNLLLAAFNLIPVIPMDGGRILQCILARRSGFLSAGRRMVGISKVFAVLVIAAGLLQFSTSRYNFSLLFIGIYIVLLLGEEKTEAAFVNVKHIIYRCSRFSKKGAYPVRELVALQFLQLGEILKDMDFDRFHIVHVLNDSYRIVGTFTEQEIIEELLNGSPDMTFKDLIAKKRKAAE